MVEPASESHQKALGTTDFLARSEASHCTKKRDMKVAWAISPKAKRNHSKSDSGMKVDLGDEDSGVGASAMYSASGRSVAGWAVIMEPSGSWMVMAGDSVFTGVSWPKVMDVRARMGAKSRAKMTSAGRGKGLRVDDEAASMVFKRERLNRVYI